MGNPRYAIYYSPEPESDLWRLGSCWLGRDAATCDALPRLKTKNLDADWVEEITAQPAHYGFHATLKPPFYLSKGHDLEMLDEALEAFAAAREPFKIPALELADLDGFVALRPQKKSKALNQLAEDCVKAFDHFRAPPCDKELKKCLSADLTNDQAALLNAWGYPYVMDEFRFHMTLSSRLKAKERKAVLEALTPHTKGVIGKKMKIDVLTLFKQKNKDEPFCVVKCYPLNRLAKPRWPKRKTK